MEKTPNNKKNKENQWSVDNNKSNISQMKKFENEKEILDSNDLINILIRFGLVVLGFSIWILYRFLFQSHDKKWNFIYCFEDKLLTQYFWSATKFISQNLYIRDFLLIASSAFLDVFMICFMIVYITKGNSWNPLVHMGLFYAFRGAVVQSLVIMQIYDTYIFEYPGFPSLVVPYFRAADFFYSGHSGCALLLGLQMSDMGYSELKYVGFAISLFEGLVLTMLRIHYSIDIIFGIICSHYFYYISKNVSYYLDIIYPMGTPEEISIEEETKILKNDVNKGINKNNINNVNDETDSNSNKDHNCPRNQLDEIIVDKNNIK